VTTSDNRLIVVRAWRDSDRLVIRLIISAGLGEPAVESVFSDIESAADRLTEVLTELRDHRFRRLIELPAEVETER
jgi:hypothetical protein